MAFTITDIPAATGYRTSAMAMLGLAAAIGVYLLGGSGAIDSQRSPDGKELVEFRSPSRWAGIGKGDWDMPAYAVLKRAEGTVLGESGVFELSGQGEVFWERDRVQVGTSAVFDRRRGAWKIIQQ